SKDPGLREHRHGFALGWRGKALYHAYGDPPQREHPAYLERFPGGNPPWPPTSARNAVSRSLWFSPACPVRFAAALTGSSRMWIRRLPWSGRLWQENWRESITRWKLA